MVDLDGTDGRCVWIFPCRIVTIVERVDDMLSKGIAKSRNIVLEGQKSVGGQTSLNHVPESTKRVKREMTVVILMGSIEAHAEEPANGFDITAHVTDSSRLTAIQKRLIHANVVRRNRIEFATRSMKRTERPIFEQPQLRFISVPDETIEPASQIFNDTHKVDNDRSITGSESPIIVAPSVTQTATELESQFKWEQSTESKTQSPSVMTKVTRTGAAQDYPACPKPILDDILQCPYCADILPTNYAKNTSRWTGHVAQDVLPHICICSDCQTPDKMYLTSDELLKHMLNNHGVVRWVCDHCATKSMADESFIFACLEDWESHMKREHTAVSTASQLLPLSRVSQRRMLEPQECPLCGYAAEHPASTLDDHITKHLHGFALRCLPWGTDGDNGDSVRAKSADASSLSEVSDEEWEMDEKESQYLNATEAYTPTQLCKLLRLANSSGRIPFNAVCLDRIKNMDKLLKQHISFLETQASSIELAGRIEREQSNPIQLSLFEQVPSSGSHTSQNLGPLTGNITGYSSSRFFSSFNVTEKLSEAAISHLFKITQILYQTTQHWGSNGSSEKPLDAFELYCNEMLHSNATRVSLKQMARDAESDIHKELAQRWKAVPESQKIEFEVRLNREMAQMKAYLISSNQESQQALEDELGELESVFEEIVDKRRTEPPPSISSQSEVIEVYAHPDAIVDIVFVHGLYGSPRQTWQSEKGTFWPWELLPASLKSGHARILVYGYNADAYAFGSDSQRTDMIRQNAQNLLTTLALERKSQEVEEHPIIFVAHSLGGILVKRALELAADVEVTQKCQDLRSIFISTYAIMFLGTPHMGHDIAKWRLTLQRITDAISPQGANDSNSQPVKMLQANMETLENINLLFLDHLVEGVVLIVGQASASPLLPGVTYFGIDSTHTELSKFDSKYSPGFRTVSKTLRSWTEEGTHCLNT